MGLKIGNLEILGIVEIKKQNGLVYIPHPSDSKRKKTVLEEKETHENNLSIRDYEALYASTTNLKEEVDATMGAIYEVLPLYKGEIVVEKQTMELEEKYFNFIKELNKKIPEWGLM